MGLGFGQILLRCDQQRAQIPNLRPLKQSQLSLQIGQQIPPRSPCALHVLLAPKMGLRLVLHLAMQTLSFGNASCLRLTETKTMPASFCAACSILSLCGVDKLILGHCQVASFFCLIAIKLHMQHAFDKCNPQLHGRHTPHCLCSQVPCKYGRTPRTHVNMM